MKKIEKFLGVCLLIVCCLSGGAGKAANPVDTLPRSLYMVGRYANGKVRLRWAAADYPLWKKIQESGVVLERFDFNPKSLEPPVRRLIPLTPFLSRDTALIRQAAQKDPYTALLGEAVYAEDLQFGFTQTTDASLPPSDEPDSTRLPDWAALRAQQESEAVRFVLANLAYDRSYETACLGGMGYTDADLSPGHYYLYRLTLPEEPESLEALAATSQGGAPLAATSQGGAPLAATSQDSALLFATLQDFEPFVAPPKDTAIFFTRQEKVVTDNFMPIAELQAKMRDGKAHLSWPHAEEGVSCIGYFIERAVGNAKKFTRLNQEPYADFVQEQNRRVSYTDSLPDITKEYRYRVLSRDIFGDERVVAMSRSGRDEPYLKSFARLDSLTQDKKSFVLHWTFPQEEEQLLQEFELYAAPAPAEVLTGEPLVGAIDPARRNCRIEKSKMPASAYLYLVAKGDMGETQTSLPLFHQEIDSLPPAQPLGLRADVDSSGVLTLSWQPSPEADLDGYRVFFALKEDSEPVQLTSRILTDTFYVDTLTLMSPQKFCYAVCAADKRGNLSPLSDYVKVGNGRPDKPVPPCFSLQCPADPNGLTLRWENSPSDNLCGQELQYRTDDSQWMTLKDFQVRKKTDSLPTNYYFRFPSALWNRRYEFRLLAYGTDRTRDTAYTPFNHVFFRFAEPPAPKLLLTPDRERKFVHVQWTRPERGDVRKIYLYRQKGGEKMMLYRCLAGEQLKENFLVDAQVNIDTDYAYRIQVEFSDGTWTAISEPSTVTY